MERNLQDFIVVSDMDGTLLKAGIGVPEENRQAVADFAAAGGRFTIATGRHHPSALRYLSQVDISAPAILNNGALIYDYAADKPLRERFLPQPAARQVLAAAIAAFGGIGAEIMCEKKIYVVKNNAITHRHTSVDRLKYIVTDVENIPQNWYKILFCLPPAQVQPLCDHLQAQNIPGVYYVRTGEDYLEVMAEGVDKGEALHDLAGLLGLGQDGTIAIGDYYNDLQMLRAAHFSVAMQEAPDDIKVEADMVTGPCLEGGVAQFLSYLQRNYTQL